MTRPTALHHHAFVVADQRATRAFYEGVLGLPLVATWTEAGNALTDGVDYCHTFFELEDGSALAFFTFADPAMTAKQQRPGPTSPFDHIALRCDADVRDAIVARADAAGVPAGTVDHGYCVSTYLTDPDGLLVELTVDHPDVASSAAERRARAGADLDRWLAGDRRDNNPFRPGHG